jgi:SHS2 domain-containing protein
MYELFEHTADLGLRVTAPELQTLLADAARGLFSIIIANLDDVRLIQERKIAVSAAAPDYLLFDWLSELLYIFETEHLVLAEFVVRLSKEGLLAIARGEPFDPARHVPAHEVKAFTYHGLTCEQSASGWLAEVIVDI